MRTRQPVRSPLYLEVLFACTAHPIIAWTILLLLYFELRAGLAPMLAPFAKYSPNQIPAPNGFDFKHYHDAILFHLNLENTKTNNGRMGPNLSII